MLLFLSCSLQSPESKSIQEALGKELKLNMFRNVLYNGDTISFETFQNKFKYKSIVYLLNDCSPCFTKYILWHNKMEKIEFDDNYSILFIISGKNSTDFLSEVELIEHVDSKYFIVMDPNFTYPDGNTEIPGWILEESVMLDENNKIKMIGQPFADSEVLKQFKKIIEIQ